MILDANVPCRTRTEAIRKIVHGLPELGYDGCVLNNEISTKVSSADRCAIEPFDTAPLGRRIPAKLGIQSTAHFRQYTRISCPLDNDHQLAPFTTGNAVHALLCCEGLLCLLGLGTQVLRSYDLVAVRPATGALFAKCCTTLEIDIISLDMSAKLPFHLRPQLVRLSSRPEPCEEPVCRWPRQLPEVWCLSCVTRSCSRTSHLEGGR